MNDPPDSGPITNSAVAIKPPIAIGAKFGLHGARSVATALMTIQRVRWTTKSSTTPRRPAAGHIDQMRRNRAAVGGDDQGRAGCATDEVGERVTRQSRNGNCRRRRRGSPRGRNADRTCTECEDDQCAASRGPTATVTGPIWGGWTTDRPIRQRPEEPKRAKAAATTALRIRRVRGGASRLAGVAGSVFIPAARPADSRRQARQAAAPVPRTGPPVESGGARRAARTRKCQNQSPMVTSLAPRTLNPACDRRWPRGRTSRPQRAASGGHRRCASSPSVVEGRSRRTLSADGVSRGRPCHASVGASAARGCMSAHGDGESIRGCPGAPRRPAMWTPSSPSSRARRSSGLPHPRRLAQPPNGDRRMGRPAAAFLYCCCSPIATSPAVHGRGGGSAARRRRRADGRADWRPEVRRPRGSAAAIFVNL